MYVDPNEVMVRGQKYTFYFDNLAIPTITTITEAEAFRRIEPLGLFGPEFSNPSLGSWNLQLTFTNPFVGKTVKDLAKALQDKLTGAWYQAGKFQFREAGTGAPDSTATSQFQKYAIWAAVAVAAIAIGFGFVQGFTRGAVAAAVGGRA